MWKSNNSGQERPTEIIVFLLILKRLWTCYSRLRKIGEEVGDRSEVGKPVYKEKDMLVFKNHVLRSRMEGEYSSRGGAGRQWRLTGQLGVTKD